MISQTCQCNLPIIILGDFNEDLVDKPNSPLLILMENNGFSQRVSYRTVPDKNNLRVTRETREIACEQYALSYSHDLEVLSRGHVTVVFTLNFLF